MNDNVPEKNSAENKEFSTKVLTWFFVGVIVFGGGFFLGIGEGKSQQARASEGLDLRPFWEVYQVIQDRFVSGNPEFELDNDVLVNGAIEGMVEALDDPYSVFFPPVENAEFQESIEGEFEGVGMEVGIEEGVLTVIAPLRGTPAEAAGIKSGDVIIAIDDTATQGKTIDESISLIRGAKGTEVVVTVFREGEEDLIRISIIRDVIEIPTLQTEIRDDVFIISLYNFTGSVQQDFKRALTEFISSGTDKIILDLRGNPGGYLGASIDVAGYFLPAGKVILREDFGDEGERLLRGTGGIFDQDEIDMVVLIDGGSASASEIVAGALSEHGAAVTIGTQTFGKGSVQELVPISRDTSLKLTVARWLTPKGVSISDGGLEPDILVEFEEGDFENEYDRQLEEALNYLNS